MRTKMNMGFHFRIIAMIVALFLRFRLSNASEKPPNPEFEFSWPDEKDTFRAGETAAVKIRVVSNSGELDKDKFRPTISVNGKVGNSSYVTDVVTDLENWKISFIALSSGSFNLMINEDNYQVLDSSLHFQVEPGELYPSVSVATWMGPGNEFEAGSTAVLGVLPKDAFGNSVTSTNGDPSSINFTLAALYSNGSVAGLPNVTRVAWNGLGYIEIEFIVVRTGHFYLLVRAGDQALSGNNPLPFKVNPGPLEVSNCVVRSKHDFIEWQLFSEMELSIHQQDRYGNLAPGPYDFDAEVIERETNLSVPIPDLSFKEAGLGIQRLSFLNLEPGNFSLVVSNLRHNKTIADMPYLYTVFVGYCNGSTSILNGSGLNDSVAGVTSEFSVYLRDSYQFPSPVQPERLRVQIVREIDSFTVPVKIIPLQTMNDTELQTEIAPSPYADLSNRTVNSTVLVTDFNVIYTPEKSGIYTILVFCGNILLNEEYSYTKEVSPGKVNLSLSAAIKFEPKVPKKSKNEVTVQLVDSFYNPIVSQQSRLKLEVSSAMNTSVFSNWSFLDNNDGSYTGYYTANDIGTYQVFPLFDDKNISPPSFEVNVYAGEYFPRAIEDKISVWEDESVAFNALANDFFAGENASLIELSEPSHGSLLRNGELLRYTPHKDYYGNDSFVYTISDVNGNRATSSVNISVKPIPPQFISFPTDLHATEDEISPKFGGFSGFELRFSDVLEKISVNVSARSGTIFLAPMAMQFWPMNSKISVLEAKGSLVLEGTVEAVNFALKSIQYFGNENFFGVDNLRLSTRSNNGVNNLDVPIYVDPVNDPPFVHVPEFIFLKSSEDKSLILNSERDKFEFRVGDPDLLHGFPGNESLFRVVFSVEVDNGFLSTSLPSELINTTELKTLNTHQWQPLQTYVTISQHFIVKANGIKFRGTLNDCNTVMSQLFYYGNDHGSVMTVSVNDMGNYGCHPNCDESVSSMPLYSEATVNLIRRRPRASFVSHAIGSAIVIESIAVLFLGVFLLSLTCKCALVLVHDRSRNNKETVNKQTTM